jgi:hypothetical protein
LQVEQGVEAVPIGIAASSADAGATRTACDIAEPDDAAVAIDGDQRRENMASGFAAIATEAKPIIADVSEVTEFASIGERRISHGGESIAVAGDVAADEITGYGETTITAEAAIATEATQPAEARATGTAGYVSEPDRAVIVLDLQPAFEGMAKGVAAITAVTIATVSSGAAQAAVAAIGGGGAVQGDETVIVTGDIAVHAIAGDGDAATATIAAIAAIAAKSAGAHARGTASDIAEFDRAPIFIHRDPVSEDMAARVTAGAAVAIAAIAATPTRTARATLSEGSFIVACKCVAVAAEASDEVTSSG